MNSSIKNAVIGGQKIEYVLTYKSVKRLIARTRNGKIYISANPKVSISIIEKFLQDNAKWVLKVVNEPRQNLFYYSGNCYAYEFIEYDEAKISFDKDKVTVFAPDKVKAGQIIDDFYKEKAKIFVQKSMDKYFPIFEQKFGIEKPKLIFKKYRSKWGSCMASKGEIRFNTLLAKVPESCVDYVVCHELSHLIEMNHSKNFYAVLSSVFSNYKSCKELLKRTNYIDF